MIELKALQAQVKTLVEDLRGQVAEAPEGGDHLPLPRVALRR
ncbi:hypothetical protein [Micromonospora sp. RTP1Z1]|nr:hypothetical protein [Micromonospora sp. RTP1Z1]